MKFATVRDLKNRTSEMLRLAGSGKNVLITRHGRPVAVLHGLGEEDIEDWVLGHHPGLRASIEEADREYRKKGGISLAEMTCRIQAKAKRASRRARR